MLGQRLKELRNLKRLTQDEIAKKLHLTRSTYAQYEVDRRVPEYATLEKLADFFDVSIDYLVGRDNRDSADKLNEYLEMELTNEEIKERMTFKVDDITLSSEEVDEFVDWVRVQRLMKKQRTAALSKPEEI